MNIGVIDADLLGNTKHRFPNLACMKISGYYKEHGNKVDLILDWNDINNYDKVYVCKVFDFTEVPIYLDKYPHVTYGGTGFFFDKSPQLPYEIEHHMPDYHLYDGWVESMINQGWKRKEFEYYLNFSIGFTTRGCFRSCEFCVNRNCKRVKLHSPLEEFYDPTRKYICLLDDNLLGYGKWKEIINKLKETKKPFQYKQGLDVRLLTEKRVKILSEVKYKGDYIFAFDNIEDKQEIIEKIKIWKYHVNKTTKLYAFCGFDRNEIYDSVFYKQDIIDLFERIKILMQYKCLPYVMRHKNYTASPYKGIYITAARWCNQPNFYKKKSFREFCEANGEKSSAMRYLEQFEKEHPEIAKMYFDLKYEAL